MDLIIDFFLADFCDFPGCVRSGGMEGGACAKKMGGDKTKREIL